MHDADDFLVSLFLCASLAGSLNSWKRLLYARLVHLRGFLSVIVIYAPTDPSDMENKKNSYDQLSSLVNSVPPLDELCAIIRASDLTLLRHFARLNHVVPAWKALDLALRTKSGVLPSPEWRLVRYQRLMRA